MKSLKRWGLLFAAAFLCGCFQVKDELSLQPDGSGTVRLTVRSSLPEEMFAMFGMSQPFGGGGETFYPPVSEAQARRFFPAKDFTLKVEEKGGDEGKTLVVEASFKDVNALLASPYARAHQLSLKTDPKGALKLQALTGAEAVARAADLKPEGEMAALPMPGLEEARKKKGELRFEFSVSLPNAVTEANGTRAGKTVTWATERAKCKDDAEFVSKLSGLLEARCAGEGLKFSPVTPPRLGLLPFKELVAGKAAGASPLPDTNKIVAAARFVPYALHVTRSLDLSGEGSGGESQARLTGAVVLPPELAPQRWGQPKLEEAVDAKGNSLMPKEESESFAGFSHFERFGVRGEPDEEDSEGEKKAASEKQHMITLSFKAPVWKVKEIGKIKGVVELQYMGGSEVVKLSNAVPANLVMDMSKRTSSSYSFDSERGQVSDSRLAELGLSVRVQMAMVQSGMTTLSLETSGGKAALLEAQVFDAEGRPWPTTLNQPESSGGEERSCQIMVTGQPKPPFSLALLVGGIGASVNLPILVEKVSVSDK